MASMTHSRNRQTLLFKKDLTSSLAKWLVKLSPGISHGKLSVCVIKFHYALNRSSRFNSKTGIMQIDLRYLPSVLNRTLLTIPEIHFECTINSMELAKHITSDMSDTIDAKLWRSGGVKR